MPKIFKFHFSIPHISKDLLISIITNLYSNYKPNNVILITEQLFYKILDDLYINYNLEKLFKYLIEELYISPECLLFIIDNWLYRCGYIIDKYKSIYPVINYIYGKCSITKNLILFYYKWSHSIIYDDNFFPQFNFSQDISNYFSYSFFCDDYCHLCNKINNKLIYQLCQIIINKLNPSEINNINILIKKTNNPFYYYINIFTIIYDITFNQNDNSFSILINSTLINNFINLIRVKFIII